MLSGSFSAAARLSETPPGSILAVGATDGLAIASGGGDTRANAPLYVLPDLSAVEGVCNATIVFGPAEGDAVDRSVCCPGTIVCATFGEDEGFCGFMIVTFSVSLEDRPGIIVFTICGLVWVPFAVTL
jgi:hypothetical protein